MFEHLDDPNPPPPRSLLVELVVAEGARRRRRRAVLAGGMAATLLVVAGGLRLAQEAGSAPDVNLAPADSPSPDSRGEGGESGDELSTAPGQTDPVTAPPNGENSTPPESSPPPETTFAALTDDGLVVLADTGEGGATSRVLVDSADNDMELGTQVALSPDRQTVYFEATPTTGDEAGESSIYEVSTTDGGEPELIATGTNPAVSPTGDHLAYIQNAAKIVLRDLRTEGEQSFRGAPVDGANIQDLVFTADAFTADNQGPGNGALVFTAAPSDGPAALYLLDLSFSVSVSASLNDAAKVGPADGAPEGTHVSTPDARTTDGTIAVVESCCAPVLDSGTAFASVDPSTGQPAGEPEPVDGVSGTIRQASYDSSGHNQLVLAVEDDETTSLYLRQDDGPLERLDEAAQYTAIDW